MSHGTITRLYDDDRGHRPHTCYDCGRPCYYDQADGQYHHLVDRERPCFLIGAEAPSRACEAILLYEAHVRDDGSTEALAATTEAVVIGNQVAVVLAIAGSLPGGPLTDAEKHDCGRHFTALVEMLRESTPSMKHDQEPEPA